MFSPRKMAGRRKPDSFLLHRYLLFRHLCSNPALLLESLAIRTLFYAESALFPPSDVPACFQIRHVEVCVIPNHSQKRRSRHQAPPGPPAQSPQGNRGKTSLPQHLGGCKPARTPERSAYRKAALLNGTGFRFMALPCKKFRSFRPPRSEGRDRRAPARRRNHAQWRRGRQPSPGTCKRETASLLLPRGATARGKAGIKEAIHQ